MRSLSRFTAPVLSLIVVCFTDLPGIRAQTLPAFDVASVKSHPWNGQGGVGITVEGNTLTAEHISLYDLVEYAWNLRDAHLSGGPSWAVRGSLASSDLYQVIAKSEGNPPPSVDQFRLMLQALLADRFQLRVHHISKELPVYNLAVAKNGPKLKESPPDSKFLLNIDSRISEGRSTRLTATHVPVAKVIDQFEHYAGRPLFDKTGLAGSYDFQLEWAPDSLTAQAQDPIGPSFSTALEKQLGLKLESAIAPFDTVVIDHAEKPSGN